MSAWMVLLGYGSLLLEYAFLALPSEASVRQLFRPGEESAADSAAPTALGEARRRPAGIKLLWYALPTGLGIALFLIPPIAAVWPAAVDALLPLRALETPAVAVLGAVLVVVGRALTIVSVVQLRRMRQDTGGMPRGLFLYSRNPGLIGMYAFYLGNACLFPNVVLFAGFVPYVLNMHVRVLMEESHLERRLGANYVEYRVRVPRYLSLASPRSPGSGSGQESRS